MQSLTNLSTVASRYDAFILDLWGVIHDGSHLYPGVHAALTQMRAAGKKIIMLSNAPRRARKVAAVLGELGIEAGLYDAVISSGEVGYQWLEAGKAPFGKRYYYIGPSKDADVVDGLDLKRVDDIKDADFLLNVGFGSEEQSAEDWMPLLRAARGLKLPMVCLNPDLEVVKQTGERFPCAGVIGYAYQNAGGEVMWFGKPYPAVYERCMEIFNSPLPLREGAGGGGLLKIDSSLRDPLSLTLPLKGGGEIEKSRILAIGDNLETDIAGAANFGMDSLLVSGGILKKNKPAEIEATCAKLGIAPDFIMPGLVW